LRYKLHAGQRKAYDSYREWQKNLVEARQREEELPGLWPKIFVMNCARRFGKDYLCLLIRIEDCLRTANGLFSYGTAYTKDIASIVIPLMERILDDCPESLRPVYRQSYQGTESGYYFPNGSVLRLVGLDVNPEGLRGRYSHGMVISEACYVSKLKHVVQVVILPQFQDCITATLILNSTPAEEPAHPYKIDFIPDAIVRSAYVKFTIMDNPRLSAYERNLEIQQQGGITSENARRELFCEDVRSETRTVIPEFSRARHCVDNPVPKWAVGYTVVDPGVRDLCAVVCGYYDFARGKLVIASDWAERNAPTARVAQAIRDCEEIAFKGLLFWKDRAFSENPHQRFSDIDARMILDLNRQHGIKISAADKQGKEVARNAVRTALHEDKIEFRSTAPITALHVEGAVWNKNRTDYERSDALGHCDALDVLIYMYRHINVNLNPAPPHGVLLAKDVPLVDMHHTPEQMRRERPVLAAIRQLLPSGTFRTRR